MKTQKQLQIYFISILATVIATTSACKRQDTTIKDKDIAKEIRNSLDEFILSAWYPYSVDTKNGGFYSDFANDWTHTGPDYKMIVTQARHIWTTSTYAKLFDSPEYLKYAEHGFQFIKEHMWDSVYGGFYMLRNPQGNEIDIMYTNEKRAYGNAFAIYALAAYYEISKKVEVLNLAVEAFHWLDEHAHDSIYLGYYDMMTREGNLMFKTNFDTKSDDSLRMSWKDHNSSIHILEAFSQLYKVWPDKTLRTRLEEMLHVVRDKITNNKGSLYLHSYEDWQPVSFNDSSKIFREENMLYDHISFGHDIETAYLLLEASHALKISNDTVTLRVAKKLIDQPISHAWDDKNGGLFYAGFYINDTDSVKIIEKKKSWWVQSETLNSLLLFSKLFPSESDYKTKFLKQWAYINTYMIDKKNKEWYRLGIDISLENKGEPKASIWKINYHNSRALMNCIQMLNNNYELARHFD